MWHVTCNRGCAVCSDRSGRVSNCAGERRVKELLNNKLSELISSQQSKQHSALSTQHCRAALSLFLGILHRKEFCSSSLDPSNLRPLVSFFFSPFGTDLQNAVFMYLWTSNIYTVSLLKFDFPPFSSISWSWFLECQIKRMLPSTEHRYY